MEQDDLFDAVGATSSAGLPLASRMRPRALGEVVGQRMLLAEGSPTRKAIEDGALGSVILWAPPGVGKTTLALLIADAVGAHVDVLSAVTATVADVRKVAQAARDRRKLSGKPTMLILDEIHRFTRTQQDSLLGDLEAGTYQMIGVTTESPFFVLAPALLSRARVLKLEALGEEELSELVERALHDRERGLGHRELSLDAEAKRHLVQSSGGDARVLLNALETASLMAEHGATLSLELVEQVLQRPSVRYDRQGDYHYDTISAFIKSVRGSDPDAALHYLARMLQAGEDPRFIVRRLMILASEDIGNADPQGLVLSVAASQAVERLGMPESRIVLGQVTTYLACAPKSNAAYLAIDKALADVDKKAVAPIPLHLRNAPVEKLKEYGHGQGYQYPHDFPGHFVTQAYLPEGEWELPYYEPTEIGHEARMAQRQRERWGGTS